MSKRPYPNLTGQTFGRLVVLRESESSGPGNRVWNCECSCGVVKDYSKSNLTSGRSQSCGCLRVESSRETGRKTKHGVHKSPEYNSWQCMKNRCLSPTDKSYANYGGRGIHIHQPWLESFDQFLMDVGRKPFANYTLDRIDTNGHYEPGNVRWSSVRDQCNNKRMNITVTLAGQTKTLAEWSRVLDMNHSTLRARYLKGLSPEQILHKGSLRTTK
jgi:hypothetical protein